MHYLHGMLEKVMEIIFINLLNILSLYNNNGCNIISIFVGFSNENLLPYLNGTIGGSPEALDPNNPSSAVIYDNGLSYI